MLHRNEDEATSNYRGTLYNFLDDTGGDHGFDVRELTGVRNVLLSYAADDDDVPRSHGPWIAEHFRKNTKKTYLVRVTNFGGHTGGCLIDLPYFFEELIAM